VSRYRKIEVRTWGDDKFCRLSRIPPCGQGLWLYMLSGPHTGPIPGLFRAGRAALAEELGWDMKGFDKAFKELSDQGMIKADPATRLMWIPNAIKHNRPESLNVIKAWGKEFDLLPDSPVKDDALAFIEAYVKGLSEPFVKTFSDAFREALRKASAKAIAIRNGMARPIQEQEQDKEDPSEDREVPRRATNLGDSRAPDPNGCAPAFDDDAPFGHDGEVPR